MEIHGNYLLEWAVISLTVLSVRRQKRIHDSLLKILASHTNRSCFLEKQNKTPQKLRIFSQILSRSDQRFCNDQVSSERLVCNDALWLPGLIFHPLLHNCLKPKKLMRLLMEYLVNPPLLSNIDSVSMPISIP